MIKIFRNIVILLALSVLVVQPAFCMDRNVVGAKDSIYEHLIDWDSSFEIDYYDNDVIDVIRNKAKNDDYLYLSLIGLVYKRSGLNAEVEAKYRTTKEQEEYVESEVNKIISIIIKDNMSDYDKVYAINQYLVDRLEYDYSLKSDNAYLAFVNGKTTCQGYSMAAYRLFKAAGIKSRIVLGDLNGISHGWNLVMVNGKWYHVDVTNDDAVKENKYFLKGDTFFRNEGFTWEAKDYEQAPEDYKISK